MVVREDGSKWACTSCLKGHRVSGCNHTERELHLVPKKGRPVTQCQHCRQERKKRSAHVSCDCAATDKPHHTKEKCIHLREADERAKTTGFFDDSQDNLLLAAVAEQQGCCCHHGGKCTCAMIRKDSSEGVPHCKPAVNKPRLEATKSDGSITVFANGHHKPIHRKNHAAHESGMPYKMPMPRSKTEHDVNYAARRSVDSLALNSGVDLPQFNSQAFQMPKSGQQSPRKLNADLFANADGLTSSKYGFIDFSDLDRIPTNESAATNSADFPVYEQMPSASLSETVFDDWSAIPNDIDLGMPNNNPSYAWSTSMEASLAQPALTAASSGTQSEIDEIPPIEDVYNHGMPSIQEVNFDSSNSVLGNSPQTNRRSLPPGFFGNIDFSNNNLEDWQGQLSPDNGIVNDKSTPQAFAFNDPWQSSTLQNDRRAVPISYASPGRPMARSVGPANAPNADIMKQLFPDMDVDMATWPQPRSRMGVSNSISVSDEDETYIAQAWADGSMSVPIDPIGTPLGLEQAFGGQDFNAQSWSQ